MHFAKTLLFKFLNVKGEKQLAVLIDPKFNPQREITFVNVKTIIVVYNVLSRFFSLFLVFNSLYTKIGTVIENFFSSNIIQIFQDVHS